MIILQKKRQKKHNSNWPGIHYHLYRILIIAGSESGRTSAVLNFIKQQDNGNYKVFDKI